MWEEQRKGTVEKFVLLKFLWKTMEWEILTVFFDKISRHFLIKENCYEMENLKHMKKLNGTKVLDKVKKNILIIYKSHSITMCWSFMA